MAARRLSRARGPRRWVASATTRGLGWLLLPLAAGSSAAPWDEPLPGYRQMGCYAVEATARRQAAGFIADGIDSQVLFKPGPGCWSVSLREQRAPALTYQIGAFQDAERARQIADSVDTCGFQTEITEVSQDQRVLYRVRTRVSSDAHARELFELCLRGNPYVPHEAMLVNED
jgi:hypothetical protein